MLNWARTVRIGEGRLLDLNPLSGIRGGREPNPRRPIATWDRFVATRQAIRELLQGAGTEYERRRWASVDLALVLAEGTGRRLGAIRQLQWNDVDWDHKTIRWRAESDKKRREWVVPVPDVLLAELRRVQRHLGVVGGLVFPSQRRPETPMSRHEFQLWLKAAEVRAGLPKLEGGLWHPYRRKWATERKQLPITDVAAAGGWHDTGTLLACYQQPTNDALLAVMSEERKVRDIAVVKADLRRNG
jgi:integrase